MIRTAAEPTLRRGNFYDGDVLVTTIRGFMIEGCKKDARPFIRVKITIQLGSVHSAPRFS